MRKPEWSSFRRAIYIRGSQQELYNMWATQQGLEKWFLMEAPYQSEGGHMRKPGECCQSGDSYRWKWHNWDGEHTGKVIEANGTDKLVMEFSPAEIEIRIYPGREMMCVDLFQYNMPVDDENKYNIFHGCSNGWTFWLANLKAVAEHGISLNDTSPGATDHHRDFDIVNI